MSSEAWFLVLSALLWLAIAGVWGWWVGRRLRRRRRLATWPRVSARVTQVSSTMESATIDGQTQRYRAYRDRYEFTDPTGQTRSGERRSSTPTSRADLVAVMHDPDDPASHEPVRKTSPVWTSLFFLALFTLGVGLFAVPTLLLGLGYE